MFEYINLEVVKATLLFIAMFYLLLASASSKRESLTIRADKCEVFRC